MSFVDEGLWAALTSKLGDLLKVDVAERAEDDQLVIERILILVRNVLQVPRDSGSERRTDDDVSLHDQVLWVLHKSGMEDLLLYMASSDDETQYCLHVLEIVSLMFKEQDPKALASANFARSKEEKSADERQLIQTSAVEEEQRRRRLAQSSGRHSRFGGTYVLKNVSSISDSNKLIWHNPLQSVNRLDFDREKRPKKTAKNKLAPTDSENTKRRSTLAIRLFLKEFCIEFIGGAYNKLMNVVKDSLNRQRAQQNDESYYLWAMRFFMEFNRCYTFKAELVSETLSKSTFHYVQQQIELYKDNFDHEKRNRPAYLLWSRRMHLALRAYGELLFTLVAMDNSKNEDLVKASNVIKTSVFYEPEYRELCLTLFAAFTPDKMSAGFLKDLVETTHLLLKLMEHMSKKGHLVVGKRIKVKKKGKGGKSGRDKAATSGAGASGGEGSTRETKETMWDVVSGEITNLMQEGDDDSLPSVTPFDATLEIDISDQKAIALYSLQLHLKNRRAAHALALLRASREVWPEGDVFGEEDAEPEDEFMILREILFAEMERPRGMPMDEEVPQDVPEDQDSRPPAGDGDADGGTEGGEANDAGDVGEVGVEQTELDEEEEYEEVVEQYSTSDQVLLHLTKTSDNNEWLFIRNLEIISGLRLQGLRGALCLSKRERGLRAAIQALQRELRLHEPLHRQDVPPHRIRLQAASSALSGAVIFFFCQSHNSKFKSRSREIYFSVFHFLLTHVVCVWLMDMVNIGRHFPNSEFCSFRFACSEGCRISGRIGRCCEATRASKSCTSLANIS